MIKASGVFLAIAALSFSQTPDLSGTWKADLTKSKLAPPPKDYVEVIEQNGPKFNEQIGNIGAHGQQRWSMSFSTDKPSIGYVLGVPTRLTAAWEGNVLTLKTEIDGRPGEGMSRRYELSGDGKTLTISGRQSMGDRQVQFSIVLAKQGEEAAAWLREPEELATKHFENVKTPLKELPVSQFIDQMRYFSWALNKECEFCHVKGHFDSDDKKEKRTARQMITMTVGIDKDTFEGKPEVRCFTCHEFREHPLSRPRFDGEPEHHHSEGNEAGEKNGN